MSKKQVLNDFTLPAEGDIIDQIAGQQQEAARIKDQVDFLGLLTGWGFTVKQNGRGSMINCPFHPDKKPSCSVNADKKRFHCFGCGQKGDVIDFVRLYKQTDFKGALALLKKTGSLSADTPARKVYRRKEPVATAAADPPEDPRPTVTLDVAADYYHKRLYATRRATAYLQERGITDSRLHSQFRIGYCDGTMVEKTSARQLADLKALGLVKKSGREHFSGCLVFPILDHAGKVVHMYGRSISKTSKVPHLYLPGSHKSVWGRKASRVYDEIILAECILDALSLVQAGVKNVQALYGTNGFTETHMAILKADRVKTIILALDNDPAGRKAAEKLSALLIVAGISVKQILPDGKDWNEDLLAGTADALAGSVSKKIEAAQFLAGSSQTGAFTVQKTGRKYLFAVNGISYRLLGVKKAFVSSLRVNIKAEKDGVRFLDNADLNSYRSRSTLSQQLSRLFDIPEQRIENDLLAIVDWLEAERDRDLEEEEPTTREQTPEEIDLGMELLTSQDMFTRIVNDLAILGYVGEELNKLLIYLAASSRKLDDPISVLILSQSASGKSLLVETVRKLIPPEDVVAVSSLSDQALNYMTDGGLLHKFLILGEAVHSEVVEHQIREMLSNHELSRMVTTKNDRTGQMETSIIKSRVIVSAMLSSTRYDVNPENASRCFVINTDETRQQTRNIHLAQKQKYSIGRFCEKQNDVPAIIRQHHAAQRLLKKRIIVNPFAEYLDFPDSLMRTRRDHERFIDLIAAVCFLRQYQKEEREVTNPVTGADIYYIECDLTDYEIAYRIMTESVLGSMYSELPKSLVLFYEDLRPLFRKKAEAEGIKAVEVKLTQRDIRKEITRIGQESVKLYLRKLAALEYLYINRGGPRGSRHSYRLVADESVDRLDCSMIPPPEEIRKHFSKSG